MKSSGKKENPEFVGTMHVYELRAKNMLLRRELAQLRAENIKLKLDSRRLDQVLSSKAWRATGLLRLFGRLIKGEFRVTRQLFGHSRSILRRILIASVPGPLRGRLRRGRRSLRNFTASPANHAALQAIIDRRCSFDPALDPARAQSLQDWPILDLSMVTFNSKKWLGDFLRSLAAQEYPLDKLHLWWVDQGSEDGTVGELEKLRSEYAGQFGSFQIITTPNRGFGAGHNKSIGAGASRFCLVSNVDLLFEKDSLRRVVAIACADDEEVACWELRQKPYEHPKFYDPVTCETNWCSHACVLLRRSAFESVGGYDETIFMYGEDVELSYRLRQRGLRLRYCPSAVVWHFAYEHPNQIKPLQYTGSAFANFYLRLRYGTSTDVAAIPALAWCLLRTPEVYPGSRRDIRRTIWHLLRAASKALACRRKSKAFFPFRAFDYDLVRDGAFVAAEAEPEAAPLVSIVTRTFAGRGQYLSQAMFSVAHQTYRNIEYIVVEDGGETQREIVARLTKQTGMPVTFVPVAKMGRSAAGNAGLAAATGDYVMFLDDDDLLFADHVSTLMQAIRETPDAAAAYSLAWDVPTEARSNGYAERMPVLHKQMQQSFDPDLLRVMNYIPIQSMVFRKSLYLERGGFDIQLDALEDWNLWNRYAVSNTFSYVPKVTSLFRTPAEPLRAQARQKALDAAYPTALARNREMIAAIEEELSQRSSQTEGWTAAALNDSQGHLEDEQVEFIRATGRFDEGFYPGANESHTQGMDPIRHYLRDGESRGYAPARDFDPIYYGERHPDVAEAGCNRFLHYLQFGIHEGRRTFPVDAGIRFPTADLVRGDSILLLVHDASRTGAPILAWNLLRKLKEQHDVLVLLRRGGELVPCFEEAATAVFRWPENTEEHPVDIRRLIERLVATYRPIYAIANSAETRLYVGDVEEQAVPTIALIHEFAEYMRPGGTLNPIYSTASSVIFPAHIVAQSAYQEYPVLAGREVHILPQGPTQIPKFPPDHKQGAAPALLQDRERFLVVGMGAVHFRKGADLFISVAARVRQIVGDRAAFLWVGPGYDPEDDIAYSAYLRDQANRFGLGSSLELSPPVDDVAPIYDRADLFLLSSRLDPLPNVAIDAALRGVPIVCFDQASGIAELLKANQETRELVVPYLNCHAAARAISDLVLSPECVARRSKAIRELARRAFDMDRYVANIEAIGQRLATRASSEHGASRT